MPNYVGTCGCGELKPFDYEPPVPADDAAEAPVFKKKPAADKPKTATPARQPVEPKATTSTPNSTVTEKTSIFGKKKLEVKVTPLDQRSDTWTCPNCGKVMPNYVGTCGCGELKPFEYEPPVPENDPAAVSAPPSPANDFFNAPPEPAPQPAAPAPVIPEQLPPNTWKCPSCGKIIPNYVGTCGCGEVKPFEYDGADEEPTGMPFADLSAPAAPNGMTPEMAAAFENVQPSISGYNPQITPPVTDNSSAFGYVNRDNAPSAQEQDATDVNFIQPESLQGGFQGNVPPAAPMRFDDAPPAAPMRFNDAPPAAAMRFDDAPPASAMRFDDAPPAAPMRFDDAPPAAPMRFDDAPPASPMRFNDAAPAAKPAPAPKAPPAPPKEEKKHRFGKKAKEQELLRQAQEVVNNRKDVPNDGTWTCPNCGKVMPKYVGTCGCGESQPFEF